MELAGWMNKKTCVNALQKHPPETVIVADHTAGLGSVLVNLVCPRKIKENLKYRYLLSLLYPDPYLQPMF